MEKVPLLFASIINFKAIVKWIGQFSGLRLGELLVF